MSATRLIFTIDLMPLNPYFHGMISRTGAPSCTGSLPAVQAGGQQRERVHRLVHAQPFDVGPLQHVLTFCPGIIFGSNSVVKATYFAPLIG